MIVVDTSAVVAVLLGEDDGRVEASLVSESCVMSAATRVELGIVIEARVGAAGTQLLDELLDRIGIEIVPVDEALARLALTAWRRFGKGRHPAGLNYGDTFAYALARQRSIPLLFVGDDFSRTDLLTV
ncbi:MAG: type II toxin-antitoxin system VapC family toxin [Ilumatobacteraceae bacterium]